MKIWLDGQCLQTASRLRGIGRYVQGLIEGMARSRPDVELSISFNAAMPIEAVAARDAVSRWIDPKNIHVWQGVAEGGESATGYTKKRRLSELALRHHVACLEPDVVLSASPMEGQLDPAVPLLPGPPLALAVAGIFFDAIPLRYPQHYFETSAAREYYMRRFASYSAFDLNLCISAFCRTEALELTGNPASIDIGAGISAVMRAALQQEGEAPGYLKGRDYALYVGALDWRKNTGVLVEAFAGLPYVLQQRLSLVIAGPDESETRDRFIANWRASGLPPGNLVIAQNPSDGDLGKLYRGAQVLLQPALMEGFGLTALEAMSCGTPVIASDIGSLREVVARDDLLFDPASPAQLADRMMRLLGDEAYAREVRAFGLARSEIFTWDRTVGLAVDALREVVGRRGRSGSRDRQALRELSFSELRPLGLSPGLGADVMARAEPLEDTPERLIIDATYTSKVDHGTGIQRVVKNLVFGLRSIRAPRQTVAGYSDDDGEWYSLDAEAKREIPAVRKSESALIVPGPNDTLLMLDSSWDMHSRGFNSLHSARLRGARIISCLYDTVPLRYPAFCGEGIPQVFSRWLVAALGYSTGFVCISRTVADELLALLVAIRYPRPVPVAYWPLGADSTPASPQPTNRSNRSRPSFLMVGTLEPRKGHRVALDAFEQLWAEGGDVELVIVGRQGWGAESLVDRIRKHPELGRRLSWYASATDEELAAHYARTDALIAASFAEGFGLPIVEAGMIGCPAIASDIAVFREVSPKAHAVSFFEAGSPSALAEAVRQFVPHRPEASVRSTSSVRWATWEDSASELDRIIRDGDWYHIHEPDEPKSMVPLTAVGELAMRSPLPAADCRYRLDLIEGPINEDAGVRYVVRLTNRSQRVWSSMAGAEGAGIEVGWRAVAADGRALAGLGGRARIPLILAPSDSLVVAIDNLRRRRLTRAAHIEVDVIEGGKKWWGSPLRLSIG